MPAFAAASQSSAAAASVVRVGARIVPLRNAALVSARQARTCRRGRPTRPFEGLAQPASQRYMCRVAEPSISPSPEGIALRHRKHCPVGEGSSCRCRPEDDQPPAGAQEVVALLEAAPADRVERQVEWALRARDPPDRLREVLAAVVDRMIDASWTREGST